MNGKIKKAKIQVLLENPFFAAGLMSLHVMESNEVPTAGVDPYGNVKINPDFVKNRSVEEIQYLLCHELLHVVFLHLIRRGNRNQIVWNIATDMAVDDFLARSGMKVFHNLNDMYNLPRSGMSAEEIYEWLVKQFPDAKNLRRKNYDIHIEIEHSQDEQCEQGEQHEQGGQDKNKKSKDSKDGKDGKDGKDSKDKGNDKDDKVAADENKKEDKNPGNENKNGEKGSNKNYRTDDIKEIEEKWRNVLIQMFHQARVKGNAPGWMEEAVQSFIEPKISWRQVLQQFIQSRRKVGSSWVPPNKKYFAHGIYLPSYYEEFLKLGIVIDTSGSIATNELKLFLSEIEGILSGVRNYEILFLQCDTRVVDERVIYTGESLPDDFRFKGRGGTDFRPAFERLEEENDLDGILFFTDGNGEYPSSEPSVPVLWALVEDYNVPFGEKMLIKIKEE